MLEPAVCESKRCLQEAARVRFYDAQGNERRLCLWCAIERKSPPPERD